VSKQNVSVSNNFHFDITSSAALINRTIYFAQSKSDTQQLVSVSSTAAGPGEYGQTGFNLMMFDKSSGLKNRYCYISDSLSNYTAQIANCADQDGSGNIWVGGVANGPNFGKAYVTELDKMGNIVLSKAFVKKENAYTYKRCVVDNIKVLKNGDILLLLAEQYDVQLIRMKPDGTVIWNKQYAFTNASVFILAQGHNSFITENAQGDIFFMSNQAYFTYGGTYLTRVTSAGNLVYTVGYQGIGYSLYLQLKFLSTGELLLFGQNGASSVPFIVKVKPDDGSVINSYTLSPIAGGNNAPVTINDIEEVNGKIEAGVTSGPEYDIFTFNSNFINTGTVKTLATSSGAIPTAAFIYDSQTNALYHVSDVKGPAPTSFIQFLRTDADGKSCHDPYTKAALGITLSSFDAGFSQAATMLVSDDVPGDTPIKFIKSPVIATNNDACGR